MVRIKASPTPNPRAMKFAVDHELLTEGKATFASPADCGHIPLAAALFDLPDVEALHFTNRSVTVTTGEGTWDILEDMVAETLQTMVPIHDPRFQAVADRPVAPQRNTSSPDAESVEAILDSQIRPALQADGGDLEVVEVDGDVVSIRFEGACGGCPASTAGTLQAIRGVLRAEYRPETEVVLV